MFRFGKGTTITLKTPTERVFCGTVFDTRGELFTRTKSFAKGDTVTVEGWFLSEFPDIEGSEEETEKSGFIAVEDISS